MKMLKECLPQRFGVVIAWLIVAHAGGLPCVLCLPRIPARPDGQKALTVDKHVSWNSLDPIKLSVSPWHLHSQRQGLPCVI